MRFGTIIAAVVLSALPIAAAAQASTASAEPDGAALYRQNCRSCHGARGVAPARMLSIYPTLKTLADSTLQAHMTADTIVAVLRHGRGKDMKPFADRLSPAEMTAVAKFVKTLGSPAAGSTGP